jgi:Ubiquitin-conjugating enzyme
MFRRRHGPPEQAAASQLDAPQVCFGEKMTAKKTASSVARLEQFNRDLQQAVQEKEFRFAAQEASFGEQMAELHARLAAKKRDNRRLKASLEQLVKEKDDLAEKAASNEVLLETICELCAETSTAAPPRQQLHAIHQLICRRIMGRWLVRELEELRGRVEDDSSSSGVQAALQCIGNTSRLHLFAGTVQGPPGTVYEGGVFAVSIVLPGLYPYELPRIMFKTKIFHPNISSQTGDIIGLVRAQWFSPRSPALSY